MKLVVQRVSQAAVRVDGNVVGEIGRGLLILLGVMQGDNDDKAAYLAKKVVEFRMFPDAQGKMNLSLAEIHGEALVVSQFTLAADGKKGRRPSFDGAAPPAEAQKLYESFMQHLRDLGIPTRSGIFAAHMQVSLVNDGPVTFVLDH